MRLQSTCRCRSTRLLSSNLPLMTLVTMLATSSAASSFYGPDVLAQEPQKRIVAAGHLTGTRKYQQVVTWRTRNNALDGGVIAHLGVKETGKTQRLLWQADEPFASLDINSVQVIDLDSDSIPEVLSLWWHGSRGATLRVFHWDRNARRFVELSFKGGERFDASIHGYRVHGGPRGKRIVLYENAAVKAGEFEVSGSAIAPAEGDAVVSTHGSSGIEGQAVISPVRPGPVREGQTDTAPFQTALVISRASDGVEAARVETGSDGRFRVTLPPGTYKVGPPQGTGRRLPRASEEIVTVVQGKFAHVTISFDSGMR